MTTSSANSNPALRPPASQHVAEAVAPIGHRSDRGLFATARVCSLVSAALLLLIIGFVALEAAGTINALGSRLLTDSGWFPAADSQGQFNISAMIIGSLLVAVLAMLVAAPLAIGSVLYAHSLRQTHGWLLITYRRLLELLAGIPSVVFGLWGLVVLVPLMAQLQPPGTSLLTGALVLALMILPTIALLADAALLAVPPALRHGGLALGMSEWRVVVKVMMPKARSGLVAGSILGLGRALGETMVVLMVCGNIVQLPNSLLDPVRTLTANIALEMAYASGHQRGALFVSGLVLTLLVIALVWAAHYFDFRSRKTSTPPGANA